MKYIKIAEIENLIDQEKEPITTNNKIQELYSKIIEIELSN